MNLCQFIGMTIRPVFILCISSALAADYSIDLSLVLALVGFEPRWRKASDDILLLLFSLAFVFVLPEYIIWRQYYPIAAGERWRHAGYVLHEALSQRITAVAYGEYRAFLSAVLLGDKSLLDEEVTAAFRVYGMSHMLAVSGFHIGFWVLLLKPITALGRSSFFARMMHLKVSLFLLIYAVTVGGSHSVFRAVWSYVLARWASISQLNIPSLHWPMFVATAHCIIDPTAPRSLSFQLSYTAVFAILIALKGTSLDQFTIDFSPPSQKTSRLQKLLLPVHISLAAWAATLPIVQHHFSGASPYFLLGNLLIVPLYTLSIWLSVPLMIFADVLPVHWCEVISISFAQIQAQIIDYSQLLRLH